MNHKPVHLPSELLTPIITRILADHFTFLLDDEIASARYSLAIRLSGSSLERSAKDLAAVSHTWLHHVIMIILRYRSQTLIQQRKNRITKAVGADEYCGHGNIIQTRMFRTCTDCTALERVVCDCTTLAGRLIALEKEYERVERYRATGMSATRALAVVWQEERVESVLYYSSVFAIRQYQNGASYSNGRPMHSAALFCRWTSGLLILFGVVDLDTAVVLVIVSLELNKRPREFALLE